MATTPAPVGDLTSPDYWDSMNRTQAFDPAIEPPWWPIAAEHLKRFSGGRLLELGCSPGHASAQVLVRVPFNAEGIDYAEEAELYLKNLAAIGVEGTLHRGDVREFHPEASYDVVMSVGLVEHFDDPLPMLDQHDRLLRPGGLCIIAVPNYRGTVQKAYHWLFDRADLRRHNLETMRLEVFSEFARRAAHDVLELRYAGRAQFWNVDTSGPRVIVLGRRVAAKVARVAGSALGRLIPPGVPAVAPWIVYVAQKQDD